MVVEQDAPAGQGPLALFDWWSERAADSVLDRPRWVRFDLPTVLLDTINSSPRIKTVSRRTSVALEQIVEQDAAFDASLLLDERVGRTNDRVGNSLATGGPPRLIEESFSSLAGVKQTGRRGTDC